MWASAEECNEWDGMYRNAMNGMGCTGEAGQTSKAGQFLRLQHSTWKILYIQFFELLEANAAKSRVVKHVCI